MPGSKKPDDNRPDKYIHRRDECECEETAREERERTERYEITRNLIRDESGITGELAAMRMKNLEERPELQSAISAVKRYVRDYPQVGDLVLSGEPGVGKTHLAAAIGNRLLDKLVRVVMVAQPNYLSRVKAGYDRTGTWDPTPELIKAKLLIFDDMGEIGGRADWVQTQLYTLINSRYTQGLPTIITTNHRNPDSLGKAVGVRVVDRLLHRGEWVDIEAESYRMRAFKQRMMG